MGAEEFKFGDKVRPRLLRGQKELILESGASVMVNFDKCIVVGISENMGTAAIVVEGTEKPLIFSAGFIEKTDF